MAEKRLTEAEEARLDAIVEQIDAWGDDWPGLLAWLAAQPRMPRGAMRDEAFRHLRLADVPYRAIEEATGWSRGVVYQAMRARPSTGKAGVYVYSFPRYLNPPALFKIGSAGSDVIERIHQQVRSAAMPEDPVLLRIYQHTVHSPRTLERLLHRRLTCPRAPGLVCGAEWFSTDLATIDACAQAVGASTIRLEEARDGTTSEE
jgi:hypothetical protein